MDQIQQPPDYASNLPSLDDQQWRTEIHSKYVFMEGPMWLANKSIASMFPEYGDVVGFKLDKDDLLDFEKHLDIDELVWQNPEPLGFIIAGIVYTLVMLILGIVWCSYKICCSRRKGKSLFTQDDEDNTRLTSQFLEEERKCRPAKIISNIFMGAWIFLFVCILFSAFTMNITMSNAIDDLGDDLDRPLSDAELYLTVTKKQFDALFVTSYANLTTTINEIINAKNHKINLETKSTHQRSELSDINRALGVVYFNVIFSINPKIFNDTAETSLLTGYFKQLHSIDNQVEKFQETILKDKQYTDVSHVLKGPEHTGEARSLLPIPELRQLLIDIGHELNTNSMEFSNAIDDIDITDIRRDIDDIEVHMEDAKVYVYGSLWGILIVLVLILVLITVGTINTGIKKKESRNKGFCRSSWFFNSGMCGVFISGVFLMMLCLVLYVFSGFVQVVCQGVRDLEKLDNDSSRAPKSRQYSNYELPPYGNIVQSCKEGKSAYLSFKLEQIYNINEIKGLSDRFQQSKLKMSIPTKKESLDTKLYTEVEENMRNLKLSIQDASGSLKELVIYCNSIFTNNGDKEIVNEKSFESFKSSFQSRVFSIQGKISSTEKYFTFLNRDQTSLLELANKQGTPRDMEADVIEQVNSYGDYVHDTILDTVGACKPMYNALNSTIESFCYKVAFPIAGFWLSLAFLLLLYVPLLITIIVIRNMD